MAPPESRRPCTFTMWATLTRLTALLLALSSVSAQYHTTYDYEYQDTSFTEYTTMTFNIWVSGTNVHDGMAKIAKHINIHSPDVVCLQEVSTPEVLNELLDLLGPRWMGVSNNRSNNFMDNGYPDTAVLTTHKIIPMSFSHTNYSMGIRIELDSGIQSTVWCMHLNYLAYGPYAANNKMVTERLQIMASEDQPANSGRVQNMAELLANEEARRAASKADVNPFIVMGDFNAPSHLDWVESTRHLHGDWVFAWPATSMLQHTFNMTDSYREMYPDPLRYPANSWSTVNKWNAEWLYTIPEPQDRIDFIFYRGPMRTVRSMMYAGMLPIEPIPNHWFNDWPSDHFSFVSTFKINADAIHNQLVKNIIDKRNQGIAHTI